MKRLPPLLALLVTALPAAPAAACNVPVFRYALENWVPHRYEVVVYHEGPLKDLEKKLTDSLQQYADREDCPTNFMFELVDLNKKLEKREEALFRSQKIDRFPWLVVRYPEKAEVPGSLHEGPLDGPIVQKLFDSPARRALSRRLLDGQTGVWVFIESGNKDKDEPRFKLLSEQLARLEKELQLPKLTDTPEDKLQSGVKLKLEFSVLKLSRQDRDEEVLVKMLLGMEEGIDKPGEPTVVPIYGRGVGLYGIVGKGINADVIADAARFLIGPCTCKIRDGNPGIALLMTADWEGGLAGRLTSAPELPPLVSLVPVSDPSVAVADSPVLESGNSRLWTNTLIALGGAAVVLLVGSLLVIARKR